MFTSSLYSLPSSASPQLALSQQVGRVAIVILNATNAALDFEPVKVLHSGGQLVIVQFGTHYIFKAREWHKILEDEWWIGSSGVGTIQVAEVVWS